MNVAYFEGYEYQIVLTCYLNHNHSRNYLKFFYFYFFDCVSLNSSLYCPTGDPGLISVRKFIRKYGGHGWLLIAVKNIIGHPKWTNTCLKMLADSWVWMVFIVDIFWRKNESKFPTLTLKTLHGRWTVYSFPFGFLDTKVVDREQTVWVVWQCWRFSGKLLVFWAVVNLNTNIEKLKRLFMVTHASIVTIRTQTFCLIIIICDFNGYVASYYSFRRSMKREIETNKEGCLTNYSIKIWFVLL